MIMQQPLEDHATAVRRSCTNWWMIMQWMVDDECHSKKRLILPIERTKGGARFEQNGSIFALLKREYQV